MGDVFRHMHGRFSEGGGAGVGHGGVFTALLIACHNPASSNVTVANIVPAASGVARIILLLLLILLGR